MNIWCVIPVFNNAAAAPSVIGACKQYVPHLLVVDDGSDDMDYTQVCAETGAILLRHDKNCGKGMALRTALDFLKKQNADYMITIDADGQHDPKDLPLFLSALKTKEKMILIGKRDLTVQNVPFASRIGCFLSNRMIAWETGIHISDSQSGFRAMPVDLIAEIPCRSGRYEYETEQLVRAVWKGARISMIPIRVHYPPKDQRISHFRPFRDTCRFIRTHFSLLLQKKN